MENIYSKVKELLTMQGETCASLEKKAQVANGTIGSWRVKSPKLETLEKIAAALGMKASDLLKEVEDGTQV